MSTELIDLHVHSNCSDGTLTPSQLVEYALKKRLRAFALTDHDTTAGLLEALQASKDSPLEVIPGIEFSTEYHGKDIHIVGLDIDYQNPEFSFHLERFRNSRDIRNQEMLSRLREAGFDISWEQMEAAFGKAVWTRAHFARYLLDHKYISDMREAFDKYIGDHCPCYVPRKKVTPEQAVHLIFRTGGIPILAHPMQYHLDEKDMGLLLISLKKAGLMGIEAIYSTHSRAEESMVLQTAKKYGLLISGGSDFHGSNKPKIDLGCGYGNLSIPYDVLKNLRDRRSSL